MIIRYVSFVAFLHYVVMCFVCMYCRTLRDSLRAPRHVCCCGIVSLTSATTRRLLLAMTFLDSLLRFVVIVGWSHAVWLLPGPKQPLVMKQRFPLPKRQIDVVALVRPDAVFAISTRFKEAAAGHFLCLTLFALFIVLWV